MENERFVCKDAMLAAYFMTNGQPHPELEERDGRVVFMFDKTEDLMMTFSTFKEDVFVKTLYSHFHGLKRAMYEFKQGKN